jgi:UDP-N-acetylmuramate dehydrogenase
MKNTLDIQANFPLDSLNTFGISANADYFLRVRSTDILPELAKSALFKNSDHFILGGGSNILFTQHYHGFIIHPEIPGIEIVEEDDRHAVVKVASGVIWDDFVKWTMEQNLAGVENLSGIPGKIGASPIQNIGAYGVEVKDVIVQVDGYDLETQNFKTFENNSCNFGYRSSIFKTSMKNRFVVCYVTFRLTKPPHTLITHYGSIEQELAKCGKRTIRAVRDCVLSIRNAKLPDPGKTGNAGSFFKNPVIGQAIAEKLNKKYPSLPVYPVNESTVKLSAAWLIEEAGCKGLHLGRAATHRNQPLVLINLGEATGKEILKLSRYIQEKVFTVFGVRLEEEVIIM